MLLDRFTLTNPTSLLARVNISTRTDLAQRLIDLDADLSKCFEQEDLEDITEQGFKLLVDNHVFENISSELLNALPYTYSIAPNILGLLFDEYTRLGIITSTASELLKCHVESLTVDVVKFVLSGELGIVTQDDIHDCINIATESQLLICDGILLPLLHKYQFRDDINDLITKTAYL